MEEPIPALLSPWMRLKRCGARHRRFLELVHGGIPARAGRDITEFRVGDFKRSDTLFVLGSGGSINSLLPSHWEEIRKHDTLAFSFWLYHDFIPGCFCFEIPRSPAHAEALYALLHRRARDYATVPVIFNDVVQAQIRSPQWSEKIPFASFERFHALFNVGIPGRTVASLARWLALYHWTGVFHPREALWYLPKKRASLSMAVAFALLCNYRKVVLCGVDLNRPDYFYDAPEYRDRGLPVIEAPAGVVHTTATQEGNPLGIDDILHTMHRSLLPRRGVELYVALKSSGLHPRIPSYFEP
jgi:hypothetical protein